MTNPSEAARLLAAQRRQVTRRCEVCGTEFTGTAKRRFCSGRCRQRAYEQRRREEKERQT
jgi:predicted nucleic acid-binding Zn ribbon protein